MQPESLKIGLTQKIHKQTGRKMEEKYEELEEDDVEFDDSEDDGE